MPVEELLFGGLKAGRVTRVDDTVRRPSGAWTPTAHALLRHLHARGFPAPAPLGLDDQGREILSFIRGRPGHWLWPSILLGPRGVRQIARLLHAYHAAVADFVLPARAIGREGPMTLTPGEIVLHGDLGPYNLIWRGESLVGAIDWDMARPGRPIEDAAFAATQCVPLRPDAHAQAVGFTSPPNRAARLAVFAKAYGVTSEALIEAAFAVHAAEIEKMERFGSLGLEPWSTWAERGLIERAREDAAWLTTWANRPQAAEI